MLSTFTNDRYVLFSLEAEDLYSYKLIHVTGTAKLIEVPIEEKHVPNIFLNAGLVSDAQYFEDTKQVVVPPVQQFLAVNVEADREQYQPREEGTLSISAKDANGRPVAAEVALGLIDESVSYIQQDYAVDPRQFYYGTKRRACPNAKQFQPEGVCELVEGVSKQLLDERLLKDQRKRSGDDEDAPYGKLEMQAEMAPSGSLRGAGGRYMADGAADSVTRVGTFGNLPVNARSVNELVTLSPGVAGVPPPPGQEPAVQVRSDFRSTILWLPDVITDANGAATIKVKYPTH